MKMQITSDPIEQYAGRSISGAYDDTFRKLTPKQNCLVFEEFRDMEKVAQAMEGWIKRQNLAGAKVRTTKAHPLDGKPRCWLVYPKPVQTEIRGNFPKS